MTTAVECDPATTPTGDYRLVQTVQVYHKAPFFSRDFWALFDGTATLRIR